MSRLIRYQGAIVHDHHILLIKHCEHNTGRSYWLFPGGGIEPGETEEDCVQREMKEETNLDVKVKSILLDEPEPDEGSPYQRLQTYLCELVSGDAKPGYEPEAEASPLYSIIEVKWFDLRDESNWDTDLLNDPLIYPPVQFIRQELGYLP